jgi:hypothetical protein
MTTDRLPPHTPAASASGLCCMLLVECKTRLGKLSPEQLATQAWAAKLGHTVHVVRSMGEFLEVVK